MCFRRDEDGAWCNMDSLLQAPVRMTTSEALEKVRYYLNGTNQNDVEKIKKKVDNTAQRWTLHGIDLVSMKHALLIKPNA